MFRNICIFMCTLAVCLLVAGCGARRSTPAAPVVQTPAPAQTSPAPAPTPQAALAPALRQQPVARTASRPRTEVVSVQKGVASWYGRRFHGRRTASGERFNMYAMTCAHRTLPMKTRVRVTNLRNGKSVVVRVNDRGPYAHGRIVDLSYAAAKKLDIVRSGTARVRLDVLR